MTWQTEKPPNNQIVEVEDDGHIIRVRAIFRREGLLPHWESEDRDTLWTPSTFSRWRHASTGEPLAAIAEIQSSASGLKVTGAPESSFSSPLLLRPATEIVQETETEKTLTRGEPTGS